MNSWDPGILWKLESPIPIEIATFQIERSRERRKVKFFTIYPVNVTRSMVYFYLQDDAEMETEMLRQFARFMKTGIKKNTNLYLFTDTKTWILNLNVSKPSDVLQFFLFFFLDDQKIPRGYLERREKKKIDNNLNKIKFNLSNNLYETIIFNIENRIFLHFFSNRKFLGNEEKMISCYE